MVDWVDLVPFMNLGVNSLRTFGDDRQIGIVDMTQTWGLRHTSNIMKYTKNLTINNKVRRFGQPLIKYLSKLMPDL